MHFDERTAKGVQRSSRSPLKTKSWRSPRFGLRAWSPLIALELRRTETWPARFRAPAVQERTDPCEPRLARCPLGHDDTEGRVVDVVGGRSGDQDASPALLGPAVARVDGDQRVAAFAADQDISSGTGDQGVIAAPPDRMSLPARPRSGRCRPDPGCRCSGRWR